MTFVETSSRETKRRQRLQTARPQVHARPKAPRRFLKLRASSNAAAVLRRKTAIQLLSTECLSSF